MPTFIPDIYRSGFENHLIIEICETFTFTTKEKNGSHNTLHFCFLFFLKTQYLIQHTFYAKEKHHLRSISIGLYVRATALYTERLRNTFNGVRNEKCFDPKDVGV